MHMHASQGGDFVIARAYIVLRYDVAQEMDSLGSIRVLLGENYNL